jgi:hypothetical protein
LVPASLAFVVLLGEGPLKREFCVKCLLSAVLQFRF